MTLLIIFLLFFIIPKTILLGIKLALFLGKIALIGFVVLLLIILFIIQYYFTFAILFLLVTAVIIFERKSVDKS